MRTKFEYTETRGLNQNPDRNGPKCEKNVGPRSDVRDRSGVCDELQLRPLLEAMHKFMGNRLTIVNTYAIIVTQINPFVEIGR